MKDSEYRKERIERLLKELQYEITRGVMDNEIEEDLSFNFFVPSRACPKRQRVYELRSRIFEHFDFPQEPRLRVVK